jgi:hypothetical protein
MGRKPHRGKHHHHHRHGRRLFVILLAVDDANDLFAEHHTEGEHHDMPPILIAPPTAAVSSILANDARTFALLILEAADDGVVLAPSKGPFTINVADPAGLLAETAGSTDNTTPTTFKLAGSSATGQATITVTDTSLNIVGSLVLTVTAVTPPPPPPPKATQLAPFLIPQ